MKKTQHYSLRLRLLGLISTLIMLAGLLIGGLATTFIYEEIGEVYDAQLVQTSKLLFQLSRHELMEESAVENISFGDINSSISHPYERNLAFRIWKDGKLVTESPSAGVFGAAPSTPGFSLEDDDKDGQYWRNFVLVSQPDGIVVEVAENDAVRTELILQILSSLFLPAILFVPMILFSVWWGITKNLKPMVILAEQVNERGSHDLAPLEIKTIAKEIAPFVDALNSLLNRVAETLRREREFTDNAAHELRTPLAAMKTQTQVLLLPGITEEDKKDGLENLHASVNRATHMVDQLLALARLQNSETQMQPLDLSGLARDICERFLQQQNGACNLIKKIEPGIEIRGNAEALSILALNLLDNAAKYGPQNGTIEISIATESGRPYLEVRDSGPGIPEELKGKIFERFFRIDKGAGTGSGLGLSLVRWIANVHRAEIALSDRQPSGLCVRVIFPAPAATI